MSITLRNSALICAAIGFGALLSLLLQGSFHLPVFLVSAVMCIAGGLLYAVAKPRTPDTSNECGHSGDSFKKGVIEEFDETLELTDEVTVKVLTSDYAKRQWQETDEIIDYILDNAIELIAQRIDGNTVGMFFPAGDGGYSLRRYRSKSEHVDPNAVIYPGKGVIGSFLKEGLKKLNLKDIVSDSITLHYYSRDAGIRSLIASPLSVNETDWGTIVIDSTEDMHFTKADVEYLDHVAYVLTRALYYAHKSTDQRLRYSRLRAMSVTEKDFFSESTVEAVVDKMYSIVPYAVQCDRITISLRDEDKKSATIVRAQGPGADRLKDVSCPVENHSLVGLVYGKNITLSRNFSDDRYETRYFDDEPRCRELRSFLIVPFGIGQCTGAILLESTLPDAFSQSSKGLLSRLATSAGVAIEKIKVIDQAHRLATHDGLTGLNNHRSFQRVLRRELKRADRYKTDLSLVICDIDHFKSINDTYGHQFGDEVLKSIAGILEKESRKDVDIPARYGGEEFGIILGNTNVDEAREITDRIRTHIAQQVFHTTQSQPVSVTMSFGLAGYRVHATRPEDIVKKADKALYVAKRSGRNRVEVF